jgi:hypothetical protein
MRVTFRGLWDAARGYQRLAYLVGAGLILIGLAHAAIWAVAGGSASGALSWRKSTTFGISFGLAAQASGVWMLLHGLALLDADADPTVAMQHRHAPSPRD